MTKLDESEIIKIFQKILGSKSFRNEDVETVGFDGKVLVSKTDTLVESTDIPPKMSLGEAARKSIVSVVSDFAAKGVKPKFGIISLNIPRKITKSQIEQIAKGIKKGSREYGFPVLGGDTNEGKEIVITICIFGITDNIVKRKGASSGDLIFSTGPFGYSASGIEILVNRRKASKRFKQKALKATLQPTARMGFCIAAKRYLTSSMDSSDGLSTTLNEMSNQSKLKFVIQNSPAGKDVVEFAQENKIHWKKLVFDGGEEYEVVFTSPPKFKKNLAKIAKKEKITLYEIGKVQKGRDVFWNDSRIKDKGWKHLR